MKTIQETLDTLEADARLAPACSQRTFIAGRVRFDVSYVPDLQRVSWSVNGRVVSRETAERALMHARAKPLVPFVR
jgi:hypothetical protein